MRFILMNNRDEHKIRVENYELSSSSELLFNLVPKSTAAFRL